MPPALTSTDWLPHFVSLYLIIFVFLCAVLFFIFTLAPAASPGQIIRLDFRNSFHIEAKEECKFDVLEVRALNYMAHLLV